jgi:hypothetical protein
VLLPRIDDQNNQQNKKKDVTPDFLPPSTISCDTCNKPVTDTYLELCDRFYHQEVIYRNHNKCTYTYYYFSAYYVPVVKTVSLQTKSCVSSKITSSTVKVVPPKKDTIPFSYPALSHPVITYHRDLPP